MTESFSCYGGEMNAMYKIIHGSFKKEPKTKLMSANSKLSAALVTSFQLQICSIIYKLLIYQKRKKYIKIVHRTISKDSLKLTTKYYYLTSFRNFDFFKTIWRLRLTNYNNKHLNNKLTLTVKMYYITGFLKFTTTLIQLNLEHVLVD